MGIGYILKKMRNDKGLTQQQVADKLQIDKSTYCGYETEKRKPSIEMLSSIASALGVSAGKLTEWYVEGNNIKKFRIKSGKTVETVAEAVGIPTADYVGLEESAQRASNETLLKIAKALDCSFYDLATGERAAEAAFADLNDSFDPSLRWDLVGKNLALAIDELSNDGRSLLLSLARAIAGLNEEGRSLLLTIAQTLAAVDALNQGGVEHDHP